MPSIPLLPGITTSISTTSGLVSIASKTARSAFAASPTVSMSGSASSTRRRPARTTAWSSTIEDADGHGSGTSATSVVPAPGVDSTCSRPPTSADALAHADETERVRARRGRVEARAVVLDHGDDGAVLALQEDADALGAGVLDDVRQRLLDDAVERRLDLGRQPLVAELRLEVDLRGRVCSRNVSAEPLDGRHEPEVVERRRAQLDREPADVLQRRDDELAHRRRAPSRASVGLGRLLERLQPEQDRRQRLARLVVELAREPRALELLRLDDAPDRVAADPLGEVDRDRRPRGERLREAQVVVGEARASAPACRARSRRRSPGRARSAARTSAEWTPSRRAACWSISGSSSTESIRSLRPRSSTRPAFEPASSSSIPTTPYAPSPSAAATRSASPVGQRDQHEPRVDELPQAARDEGEQRLELELGGERVADLVQRLELAQPARRALVEPRVLDRDRRLRGEQLRQLLVLVREVLPPSFSVR